MPALTRAMVAADAAAYRSFQTLYLGRLARYLLVLANGNEQLMRDALQETFRRVARHVRVFPDETVFWSWLTRVARTALADERRSRRRYFSFLDRFTRESESVTRPAEDDRTSDLNARLREHLAALDASDRALLEWKYFDHDSVREIADRLQTTEGAVESRLVRLRRKLKDGLLQDLNDNGLA